MAKKDFMAAFLREREQSEAVSKLDTEVIMTRSRLLWQSAKK